jgi:sodium/hydrogen antiporter
MGVGAVFISTLALTRLPAPHDPPQDQQELLAATLQPLVSFVVLGSIILRKPVRIFLCLSLPLISSVDGLSIPFFSFGRNVQSRTLSLSATLTSRSRMDTVDWLLWVRRPSNPRDPELPNGSDADIERAVSPSNTRRDAEAPDIAVETAENTTSFEPTTIGERANLTRRITGDEAKVR